MKNAKNAAMNKWSKEKPFKVICFFRGRPAAVDPRPPAAAWLLFAAARSPERIAGDASTGAVTSVGADSGAAADPLSADGVTSPTGLGMLEAWV